MFKLKQGNDCGPKSLPLSGKQPTKIAQHKRDCLTTEEAKVVYECLRQDQTISPIHFSPEIPKIHVLREAAYNKMEAMLEEYGPLNPYEHMLTNPQQDIPSKTPEFEDFYNMYGGNPEQINTHNMEEWSILSTEIHYTHRRPQGTGKLLIMQGPKDVLEK